MKRVTTAAIVAVACLYPSFGNGEILAMLNYESKSPDALKAFRSPVPGQTRQEGIAIIDVNPASPNFKKVVETIPLPPDLVAHHIFYNRDMSKAYVTALGKPELRVIDMSKRPFTAKTVSVPDCQVGEDVVFSDDNKRWFLTCMGSAAVRRCGAPMNASSHAAQAMPKWLILVIRAACAERLAALAPT